VENYVENVQNSLKTLDFCPVDNCIMLCAAMHKRITLYEETTT